MNPAAFSRRRLQWQWLAGLIDGDGHLPRDSKTRLNIAAHSREEVLLWQARELLGHGKLYRVASQNCVNLEVTGRPALRRMVVKLGSYLRHPVKQNRLRLLCLR
jgi:hypothetical protein